MRRKGSGVPTGAHVPEAQTSSLAAATAKLAGNAAEYTAQLRAKAIHHSDDRYRNPGRDQAVLDGCRAAVVIHETQD